MDKIATRILSGIQRVETEHFEGKDLLFLNMNGNGITDIPIPTLPSLVYFKNGDPEIYQGKQHYFYDRFLWKGPFIKSQFRYKMLYHVHQYPFFSHVSLFLISFFSDVKRSL